MGIPEGNADFTQHPLERMVLLVINAGELILGLVCFAAAIAGATGQLEGAGASFNLMFALVGAVTFTVGLMGLLGVLKYNNVMYVYFLVMLVSTIFVFCVVLFVAVNKDVVTEEVKNEMQDQWASGLGYEQLPDLLENFISNNTDFEDECGHFGAATDDDVASLANFESCWEYVETLLTDTYLTYALAAGGAIVFFMIIATVASLRVVGLHDIIKRTQHIVNIALGINGLVIIIFGVAIYVTLNDPAFASGAYAGYFVIACGALILITAVLGFFSQKGGSKPLELVYLVICGLFTVLALLFALIALFGGDKLTEQAMECESCIEDFVSFCNVTGDDENVAKLVDDVEFSDFCYGEGAYETFVSNAIVAMEGAGFICLFVFLFMIMYDIGVFYVMKTDSEMGEESMGLA